MQSTLRSTPRATMAVLATTVTASMATVLFLKTNTTDTEADASSPLSYKIEADLMDKIASKSYIQQRNPQPDKRPRGVPKAMRILAIDLPAMRSAFDGECRVDLKKVFPDGTAPSKMLYQRDNKTSVEILQKSLAHSVVRCRNAKSKRVGVELLEASVAELNPHNLRKTHRFGNYWYDPGKFARSKLAEEEFSPASPDDVDEHDDKKPTSGGETSKSEEVEMVLATEEDELDAPWNQSAWIEELESRISGYVCFGATMERSSRFSRIIYGNVYRQTVPSSRRLYEWFLPRFFHGDPSGVEGDGLNWASQKPHAVIADGAAMQRVPGSMKLLTDCCREANVPLYIIHDPRAWGMNTHKDLSEALRDMRHTIKGRIVAAVLEEQGGAFSRGRVVGQLETEARWQAKEIHRKTQKAIRDANNEYLRERENDWSKLDAEGLKKKLVEHGALIMHEPNDEGESDATKTGTSLKFANHGNRRWWHWRRPTHEVLEGTFYATEGMLELSRECVGVSEKRDGSDTNQQADTADESATDQTETDEETAGVPV